MQDLLTQAIVVHEVHLMRVQPSQYVNDEQASATAAGKTFGTRLAIWLVNPVIVNLLTGIWLRTGLVSQCHLSGHLPRSYRGRIRRMRGGFSYVRLVACRCPK